MENHQEYHPAERDCDNSDSRNNQAEYKIFFLGFLFSLFTVKTEFAVVENSADRGVARRRDQYEVKVFVICAFNSVSDSHNAHLLALGTNHANLRFFIHAARKDFFVDEMFLVVPIVE